MRPRPGEQSSWQTGFPPERAVTAVRFHRADLQTTLAQAVARPARRQSAFHTRAPQALPRRPRTNPRDSAPGLPANRQGLQSPDPRPDYECLNRRTTPAQALRNLRPRPNARPLYQDVPDRPLQLKYERPGAVLGRYVSEPDFAQTALSVRTRECRSQPSNSQC